MYKELSNTITDMEEEIIKGIQESIRIDSVRGEALEDAPYGIGPKAALDQALALGRSLGFRTKNVDNKAGWVEYGEAEELVGVLGHLDVVPPGDGWIYPAFGAKLHDGKLYGRGVIDDKGPSIGAIYALKAIRDLGIPIDRRIRVIFGTDEESGCSCIRHYVKAGEEIPDIGFTPDADYPLIFCEKGLTTLTVGKKEVKKSSVNVLQFQGGTAKNIVTPKCRLVIEGDHEVAERTGVKVWKEAGNTVAEAEGVSAHGSKPELGINAAVRLLEAVKSISFGGDFQCMADFILDKIGTETNGEKLGILYRDEETGETTVNLGMLEYCPGEQLEFTLDIRYPQNGEPQKVYENVQQELLNYGLEILSCTTAKVLYVPKDSDLVKKLMKVYREMTGRDDQPLAIGGGTYAKMLPNMVAFGPSFPGAKDVVHQPNEHALVTDIIKSIQLTAAAMVELAQSDAQS